MTQSGFLLHPCLVLVLVHPCLVPTPGKKSVCQCNEDVGCVALVALSCVMLGWPLGWLIMDGHGYKLRKWIKWMKWMKNLV